MLDKNMFLFRHFDGKTNNQNIAILGITYAYVAVLGYMMKRTICDEFANLNYLQYVF